MDHPPAHSPKATSRRRLTLELSFEKIDHIDALKKEWGLRNRGDVLERLLEELFSPSPISSLPEASQADGSSGGVQEDLLDDSAALVLVGIGKGAMEGWGMVSEEVESLETVPKKGTAGKGIDLPGFVQKRSQHLKRSLRGNAEADSPPPGVTPWPQLPDGLLKECLQAAQTHWLNLFGQPPNAAVIEAAMAWLAHDIWPHADLCEGKLFTWSAAGRLMREVGPSWTEASPSLAGVIVLAGVLEDPFSAETLPLRIPTLIHRFVHRFRRRQRGTSFQTLESTMTLHGALRLLQLPTDPGQRVTLTQIRDAYREMALEHHPDSGGSLDAMRRLNEAYQLLKELYRQKPAEDR
ncbi:MAG: J domain-containing protein [Cyanobium sp.]